MNQKKKKRVVIIGYITKHQTTSVIANRKQDNTF
jgi:hypothetical protein